MSPNELEGIAMIVVPLGLFVVLPVVAILTRHQRQMAEVLNRDQGSDVTHLLMDKLDQMQAEISSLRERQNDIILTLDTRRPVEPPIDQRISPSS